MPKTLFNYFRKISPNSNVSSNVSSKNLAKNKDSVEKKGIEHTDLKNFANGHEENQEEVENISAVETVITKGDILASATNKQIDLSNSKRKSRSSKVKRRRIISDDDMSDDDADDVMSDDDADDDYKPLPPKLLPDDDTSDDDIVDDDIVDEDSETVMSPSISRKRKRPSIEARATKKHSVSACVQKQLSTYQATATAINKSTFLHETLSFLNPDKLRDGKNRKPDNENYDKSTLFVPNDFLKSQTPAMYQWWQLKSNNFDTILFFKVGKFYELYHMDAVIGVKELGLIYMKGNFAHSGFPEISFGRYSDALVQKGYSVARVEQTETPDQNRQRLQGKSLSKYEKTLRREICRITTKGTQMYSAWQGGSRKYGNSFLLAVKERCLDSPTSNLSREFGVCFIDTSIGIFHIGQFSDDLYCSKLCTMLAHAPPCQVLYERTKLSQDFKKILNTGLSSCLQTALTPGAEFWDDSKTLKVLSNEKYFEKNGVEKFPEVLRGMLSQSDPLNRTASQEYTLALSCLGACMHYLKKCLIDFQILSMGQFEEFHALEDVKQTGPSSTFSNQRMVLDSVTLANLEIFVNNKGEREGSLLDCLDNCQTAFGKRLLRQWLSSPLCQMDAINERLDAIDDLCCHGDIVEKIKKVFGRMPDIERMLSNIYTMSKNALQSDHPDNRAILYEENKYSKKKIEEFLSLLEHFNNVCSCLKGLQEKVPVLKSTLLKKILGLADATDCGEFPNMESSLEHWKKAFNHNKARDTGKITPNPGTNPEYDEAMRDIQSVTEDLDIYLKEQKKRISCSKIVYKKSGNKRFQLEIPDEVFSRVPNEYIVSGQRKGFKSFRTNDTDNFQKNIEDAESRRDAAQAETMSIIFREFLRDVSMWSSVVKYLAAVDVLISLSTFSKGTGGSMCRPVVHPPSPGRKPFISSTSCRHACLTKSFGSEDFIPNDFHLGCDAGSIVEGEIAPSCLLLTGPNMGGKSTLMRQIGLLVVLGQIGSYVPAESCEFTSCDRIFTRLGASDKIMSGESTFYVELSETSRILRHASENSLVLLDELGRGTATYDGTAIAYSVLKHVAAAVGCRTIFSTHYHVLVDDFAKNPNILLGHMACLVEDSDDVNEECVTFLYKLSEGACPKSYGFYAASLAGIPPSVTSHARGRAALLEQSNSNLSKFRRLFNDSQSVV